MTDFTGKKIISITWIAPDENGAQALRDFYKFHKEYMLEKCFKEGPLKLVQYTVAESPEYEEDGFVWAQGRTPNKTGRIVFHHYEVYETEEGIHHHWIDGADIFPEISEMMTTYNLEYRMNNMLTAIHSI